ncbi:MAG: hypothetical protein ABW202_03760 [Duganella sp.]
MTLKYGFLGGANLKANQEVSPYQCAPPALAVAFTVSFCNRGVTPAAVFLAHGTGADSKAAGTLFLEANWIVKPGETRERTGLALNPGRKLFAMSDTDLVDVEIHGFEKGAV